jgi:hypothetical protein
MYAFPALSRLTVTFVEGQRRFNLYGNEYLAYLIVAVGSTESSCFFMIKEEAYMELENGECCIIAWGGQVKNVPQINRDFNGQ